MSITPYDAGAAVELSTTHLGGYVDLRQWAQEASDVRRMAEVLSTTSFVPAPLRGKPDEVAALILYGRDVNLPPMVALQQINVIEGRPSMSALAMRGLAQASGVKFRLDEAHSARCVMAARSPGDAAWTTVTWDIERAKKLGLATKSNWTKQPGSMLIARATSELCRLVAAPLFLGLAYSTEELTDGLDEVGAPDPPAAKTRTIKRKPPEPVKVAATTPEPAEETPQQRPADYDPDGPVTDAVRMALMAQFGDNGIADRATRLAYVSDLLKREVGSVNEITDTEGRQILDQLHIDYPYNTEHADEVAS